ncbi:MAG: hypothetical protein JO307_17355 [Bryobacterales bacterium]|nr:hypothetical protein [Bryobacterales bacterium]
MMILLDRAYSMARRALRIRDALDRTDFLPLMVSIQRMCGRLGMVTGQGLA